MTDERTLIRRIRKSEQEILSQFCKRDSHWKEYYYSKHDTWIKRALKDVNSHNRVVFGAFDTIHGGDGRPDYQLVACVFLKLSQFEDSIEFKNLILPDYDFEKRPHLRDLTRKLIENAVRFCEVRNILKIEVELPQTEHGLLSAFMSLNFKVVAIRDRYNPGNKVCVLERSIGEIYHGDPFDLTKLAYWLLRCLLPCKIISEEIDGQDMTKISFMSKPLSKIFSSHTQIEKNKTFDGGMWIVEYKEDFDKELKAILKGSKNKNVKIVVTNFNLSKKEKDSLLDSGIIFFEKDDLLALPGNVNSSLNIPIEEENIGGVLTVLEEDVVNEYALMNTLTYYLLSGIYQGLNPSVINQADIYGDDEDSLEEEVDLTIIAIYCPNWQDKGPGIIGYSMVTAIATPFFKDLLENEIPIDSALSKEDLRFYQTYSNNERVGQLQLSKIVLFPKPLFFSVGKWVSSDEVRVYLEKEISYNGCNSAYLDQKTVNNIIEIGNSNGYYKQEEIKEENTVMKKRFKVGLSFAGEKRDFVGKVAEILIKTLGKDQVFYDMNYEAELARIDLDDYLGKIYADECELVVPFFSDEYQNKKWCRLEWRYIKVILFNRVDKHIIMPIKFDDAVPDGMLPFDGYVLINKRTPKQIANEILKRVS